MKSQCGICWECVPRRVLDLRPTRRLSAAISSYRYRTGTPSPHPPTHAPDHTRTPGHTRRPTPHHSPASAVVVTVMATAPGRGSSEGASPTASVTAILRVPVKRHRGGAGTHTGHTGHTGARGHTDHTDEPHNHPSKPNDTPARPRDGRNRGRLNSRKNSRKPAVRGAGKKTPGAPRGELGHTRDTRAQGSHRRTSQPSKPTMAPTHGRRSRPTHAVAGSRPQGRPLAQPLPRPGCRPVGPVQYRGQPPVGGSLSSEPRINRINCPLFPL